VTFPDLSATILELGSPQTSNPCLRILTPEIFDNLKSLNPRFFQMASKKSTVSVPGNTLDISEFLNIYGNSETVISRFVEEGKGGFQLTAEEMLLLLQGEEAYAEEAPVQGMIAFCSALIEEGAGDTIVFNCFPRRNAKAEMADIPANVSFVVIKIDDVVGIYDGVKDPVTVLEATESVIGLPSYTVCEIGGMTVKLPIRTTDELRKDIYTWQAQNPNKTVTTQTFSGLPPEYVNSFAVPGDTVEAIDTPRSPTLSPKDPSIRLKTPIQILEILEPDEKYGTPKISVSIGGKKAVGMLVTAPIRKAVTGGNRPIGESDIGSYFEILGRMEYKPGTRMDAVPSSDTDGTPQMTVLARKVVGKVAVAA
jgi:hypothetical protein